MATTVDEKRVQTPPEAASPAATPPLDPRDVAEQHEKEAARRMSHTVPVDDEFKTVVDLHEEDLDIDIFKPLPPLKGVPEEPRPLTFRAVLVGIILGSLVNCSNVYLGLKTGFTFGASMFGAIFGYGIVKLLSTAFAGVPILGMPFGPQENSIIQASAAGAGGLSGLFVAALPAMYNLDLLSEAVKDDFGRILTLTVIGSSFGLFFAVPLRKFFIVNVARDLRLVFPTATATAFTIRSMHAVGSGAADAMAKIKALGISFGAALVLRVVSDYALGILWDWHIFTWFFIWGNYNNYAIVIESWGWFIEWTPAFIGSGLLVGLNVGISYFIGSFLAWGLIGPLLVYKGVCVGKLIAADDEQWGRYTTYNSMSGMSKPGYVPSPRYWLLWPGVMVLLCYSMAEFFYHFPIVWFGMKYAWTNSCASVNNLLARRGKQNAFLARQAAREHDASRIAEDFATPEQQVPTWIWGIGVVVTLVITCIIAEVQFNLNAGLAILASLLGIIFSFLAIHGSGVTDVTPLTASAKASQLVFGGVTTGQGLPVKEAQTANLIAGAIASAGADMSTTLTTDFRTGYLLRTPPKYQFYAQAVGTFVAIFIAPAVFLLFTSAYPCIVFPQKMGDDEHCPFLAPSVTAWRAVAEAVTLPSIPIPLSSGIFSIVIGVVSIIQVLVKNKFLVGEREKYRVWLPNWMAIGIAFVLPATHYATATLMGAIASHVWQKRNPTSHARICYSIAAGFMAGEGLGGVVQAALQLGGVSGSVYGTNIGCPALSC